MDLSERRAKEREHYRKNRKQIRAKQRAKYAADAAYREKLLAAQRAYRDKMGNALYGRRTARAAVDPAYAKKMLAWARKTYRRRMTDPREVERERVRGRAKYRKFKAKYIANGKRYRAQNKQKVRAFKRAYRDRHPGLWLTYVRKRQALMRSARIGDEKKIRDFYKRVRTAKTVICHWCKKPVPKSRREIDHVRPLSRGGAHAVSNLVPSCRTCNRRKWCRNKV